MAEDGKTPDLLPQQTVIILDDTPTELVLNDKPPWEQPPRHDRSNTLFVTQQFRFFEDGTLL